MDAKAGQQTQELGFMSKGNGETFNLEKNNKNLPAAPTG
jgi:hypothetical protein